MADPTMLPPGAPDPGLKRWQELYQQAKRRRENANAVLVDAQKDVERKTSYLAATQDMLELIEGAAPAGYRP